MGQLNVHDGEGNKSCSQQPHSFVIDVLPQEENQIDDAQIGEGRDDAAHQVDVTVVSHKGQLTHRFSQGGVG